MNKIFFYYLLMSLLTINSSKLNAAIRFVEVNETNFIPQYFYVNVGDVIVWSLNTSGGNHTTTSTLIPNGALAWNGVLNSTQSTFSYTVNKGGDYDYICLTDSAIGVVGHFTAFGTVTNMITNVPTFSSVNYDVSQKTVTINYRLPIAGMVTFKLYDLIGKSALISEPYKVMEGVNSQCFRVASLPKGIYIIELNLNNLTCTRKIILE